MEILGGKPVLPQRSAQSLSRSGLRLRLLPAALGAIVLVGCSSTATTTQTSAPPPVSSPAPMTEVDAAPSPSPSSSSAAESSAAESSAPQSSTPQSSAGESSAAAPTSGTATSAGSAPCIVTFAADQDYFPDKVKTTESTLLTIDYQKSYAIVSVTTPGAAPQKFVLLRCGAPKPELTGELAAAPVIEVPVKSLYSASTSHLPALTMLKKLDVLTGVSSKSFVSGSEVLAYFKSATVAEFAPNGQTDAEAVIKGKPQVLVGGGFPDPADAKITKAGIPVLPNVDASESTPLGQAEWIKLFGVLTGTEAAATATFDEIVADYNKTKALVSGTDKVKVVAGQPYQGTWYVPGGNSWKNRLIADAGGSTGFEQDTSAASITTTFEKVFAQSAKAPVWLASTTWTTEAQALKEEPRFAKFAAFAAHNVWNPVKGTTPAGGNPAYELGPARPDLMLADLVAILHPDKLPGHDFTFYVKLK